jgi:hypothetical protein
VLVQADLVLAGAEAFLHAPPGAGDADQGGEGDRSERPAAVEGQLAVADALA